MYRYFIVAIGLLSLAAPVCEAASGAPGVIVRIPRAGLDALVDGVAGASEAHAMKAPIPDVSASGSGVDLRVKQMRVSKLERPKSPKSNRAPRARWWPAPP